MCGSWFRETVKALPNTFQLTPQITNNCHMRV